MSIKRKLRKFQYLCRDAVNRVRYGAFGKANIPVSFETLWIDPCDVKLAYGEFRRRYSARVIAGDWDINAKPIETNEKIKSCRYKFENDASWEASGIIEVMMAEVEQRGRFDGCTTKEDVLERYKKLDAVFDELKKEDGFKAMS